MKSPVCFRLLALLFLSCFFCPRVGCAQEMDSLEVVRVVDSLMIISSNFQKESRIDDAIETIKCAEQLVIETFGNQSVMLSKVCFQFGVLLSLKGDFDEAERHYKQSKDLRELLLGKYHKDYIKVTTNLSNLYHRKGDFKNSEIYNIEVLDILEKQGKANSLEYAHSKSNLARLYSNIGRYKDAEKFYSESINIYRSSIGISNEYYLSCILDLAHLFLLTGNLNESEKYYSEGVSGMKSIFGETHINYLKSLHNFSVFYRQIGIHDKALELLQEVKKTWEGKLTKEDIEYATVLINIGSLYARIKKYEEAELAIKESIRIRKNKLGEKNLYYARSLLSLASLYLTTNRLADAELILQETLQLVSESVGATNEDYALVLYYLGELYMKKKQPTISLQFYNNALSVSNDILGNKSSLSISCTQKMAKLYFNAYDFLICYSLMEEFLEKSILYIKNAKSFLALEDVNKYIESFGVYYSDFLTYVNAVNSMNLKAGYFSRLAYDQSLFYKGFVLSTVSQLRRMAQADSASAKLYEDLASYQRRLSREYAKPISERDSVNLPIYEEKANALEKELARTVPGYAEALRTVSWQEVQAALKPGEAAIEFVDFPLTFPNENSDSTLYAALVLRPGDAQPQYVPLCEARQLARTMDKGKESYAKLYSYEKGEDSLYELLWKPLAPLLEGVKTIYCSPSGELHRLNLGAISMPKGGVLANRHQLRTLLSTRQLAQQSAPSSKAEQASAAIFGGVYYDADSTAILNSNRGLGLPLSGGSRGYLAYADSSFYTGSFGYLPHTKEEANAIRQKLKSSGFQTSLFLGAEATEEALKRLGSNAGASPTVLHIATHGYFSPDPAPRKASSGFGSDAPAFVMSEHPLIRSGLLLAGANESLRTKRPVYEGAEDGILTAHEVSLMNLSNTQLVVLSACETGLGDIQGNEGVYGLQRAFHIAGARYILMSLWKVDDEATKVLMEKFYQNWLVGKLPIEEAFRQAQLYLRQEAGYDDPKYWAGFVLIEG